ncbi:Rrf2 family transcriptional regulator [Paucilactobacillus wasatchensis]|uniref:Rrf2 family transcriptional regulator n=1 Tax=Paucilactobacillus wasatchensis TaxID=1335616 RepID=A0A0D1A4G5_9LACO|nr:Rrf2 family transcriptional regulator [Paucilactobacillus wasatchensis]KIS02795.1 Rrf2 family transcriptional regulator [Paucilactobacillus wasatchensis]
MQLTKATEQAACILTLLATQEHDIPLSSELIHQRLGGSQSYLQKIMRRLVVAELIKSVSGNNGGFTLAKPANEITVYSIVEAVEGEVHSYPNFGFIDRVFAEAQPLASQASQTVNSIFDKADAAWINVLKQHNLAEILVDLLQVTKVPTINWNDSIMAPKNFITQIRENLAEIKLQ